MRLSPTPPIVLVLGSLAGVSAGALAGCAAPATIQHVDRVERASASVPLAGARCHGRGPCRCRAPGDDVESEAPPAGKKRFELRMSADAGEIVVESPTLGRFQAQGAQEACFYVDVPAGSQHDVAVEGRASRPEAGFSPRVRVIEYGAAGPWWYDIVAVECTGPDGRCSRAGVEAWAARTAAQRRGRLEPCGSAVVSKLAWESSGATGDRDGALYPDLTVRFSMEVKKFSTQFAPGSTECVPK